MQERIFPLLFTPYLHGHIKGYAAHKHRGYIPLVKADDKLPCRADVKALVRGNLLKIPIRYLRIIQPVDYVLILRHLPAHLPLDLLADRLNIGIILK